MWIISFLCRFERNWWYDELPRRLNISEKARHKISHDPLCAFSFPVVCLKQKTTKIKNKSTDRCSTKQSYHWVFPNLLYVFIIQFHIRLYSVHTVIFECQEREIECCGLEKPGQRWSGVSRKQWYGWIGLKDLSISFQTAYTGLFFLFETAIQFHGLIQKTTHIQRFISLL